MTANSRTPMLAEVIRTGIESRLQDLHVALPGRIEKYDAASQKADVKPMVQRRVATADGEELLEPLPVITEVPVMFPRSGSFFVSLPLQQGDFVLLVFCERNIDNYVVGTPGIDADPDDFRLHDLSDAVAFPGFFPGQRSLLDASADRLVIGVDSGAKIKIAQDGTTSIDPAAGLLHLGAEAAAEFVAQATKTDTRIGALETAHNALVAAFNTFLTLYQGHTQQSTIAFQPLDVSSGGQFVTVGAPATPPTPATSLTPGSSVAATKAKVT